MPSLVSLLSLGALSNMSSLGKPNLKQEHEVQRKPGLLLEEF